MDPWLERPMVFPDLHGALITYLREALNAALPDGYLARGNHLVWVDDTVTRVPDVGVFGPERGGAGGTAVLPGLLALGVGATPDDREQPYLEILTADGGRLVTAVEVLSPANKKPGGNGRTAYREKQEEFRLGRVHLVEIDLLRAGPHTTAVPLPLLRRKAGTFDYHVSVRVAADPDHFFAAAIRLGDRLPAFGIPLDPGVDPVVVDLQPMLDRAYDTGRYARGIDYRRDPDPPLTPEQRAWADTILRERGLAP
jgi:hypothetical protein